MQGMQCYREHAVKCIIMFLSYARQIQMLKLHAG